MSLNYHTAFVAVIEFNAIILEIIINVNPERLIFFYFQMCYAIFSSLTQICKYTRVRKINFLLVNLFYFIIALLQVTLCVNILFDLICFEAMKTK